MRLANSRITPLVLAGALGLALAGCDDNDLLAPDTGQLVVTASTTSVVLDPDVEDDSRVVVISAQLFTEGGFPIEGANLTFSATSGVLESADEEGAPRAVKTDLNGVAQDRLTIGLLDDDQIEVVVRSGLLEQSLLIEKRVLQGDQPPEAEIEASPAGPLQTGNFVTFFGDGSSDPDGDPITCYQWEVFSTTVSANDQVYQGTTRRSFSKRYDAEQVLTVILHVSSLPNDGFCTSCVGAPGSCGASIDNFDGIDDSLTYEVVCDPTPPNAVAPGDQTVQFTGGSVMVPLSGAASTDPETGIASYSWNCGNGTADVAGASVVCTYTSPGTYSATLTVVNGCGDVDTDSTTVRVLSP